MLMEWLDDNRSPLINTSSYVRKCTAQTMNHCYHPPSTGLKILWNLKEKDAYENEESCRCTFVGNFTQYLFKLVMCGYGRQSASTPPSSHSHCTFALPRTVWLSFKISSVYSAETVFPLSTVILYLENYISSENLLIVLSPSFHPCPLYYQLMHHFSRDIFIRIR